MGNDGIGRRLDWVIMEVFSNICVSMILQLYEREV